MAFEAALEPRLGAFGDPGASATGGQARRPLLSGSPGSSIWPNHVEDEAPWEIPLA